ncbi:MAG: phosphotransferase [Lachnospiraceae bacterium]|nr:phosphotransferase [Lachnospiraceae bacterium]
MEKLRRILTKEYGLDVQEVRRMSAGVGGETYGVQTPQGKFVYKIADANEMNHPETEPEICNYLFEKGLPVSRFIKNKAGSLVTPYDDKRVSHLQNYVEGKTFLANSAPEWFMRQSPVLLGKIHTALGGYKKLPMGIGPDFFKYMTPERARESYLHSYKEAQRRGEEGILEDLEVRLRFQEKIADWKFDLEKLTYSNSHGDYTVNQIICGKEKINAVIDWTSACVHPVIWEITRSFFSAEHSCAEGEINEAQFRDYVEGYCSEAMLTKYDKDNLLRLYCYQIGVCDYYAQYLSADEDKKDEYLSQAKFATKVMRNQLMV